ncbi:MAG TPA: PPOX class F420-dependent oxidoreductase [Baekduia sp.]|nr:PPOX class F420-dependent oxidoreductase [Baekduia sp.]
MTLEAPVRALLDAPNYCFLSTLRRDGSPHVVAAWVSADGDEILLNSAAHRVWPRNLERDPRIAVLIQNAENPYEFAQIRGVCTSLSAEGADAHIDFLAQKYMGVDEYPLREPGEQRVIARIRPDHVFHFAGPDSLPPAPQPAS